VPTPNYLSWARLNGMRRLIFKYITYSGEFICMHVDLEYFMKNSGNVILSYFVYVIFDHFIELIYEKN
jgi:hypothetical protein